MKLYDDMTTSSLLFIDTYILVRLNFLLETCPDNKLLYNLRLFTIRYKLNRALNTYR